MLPPFTYGETGKDKHMSKLIELESSLRCFESKADTLSSSTEQSASHSAVYIKE